MNHQKLQQLVNAAIPHGNVIIPSSIINVQPLNPPTGYTFSLKYAYQIDPETPKRRIEKWLKTMEYIKEVCPKPNIIHECCKTYFSDGVMEVFEFWKKGNRTMKLIVENPYSIKVKMWGGDYVIVNIELLDSWGNITTKYSFNFEVDGDKEKFRKRINISLSPDKYPGL